MAVQRIRVWFRKGLRVRYISHLDVLRYWERCIRRAELPLSYSQGFTPHPKLAFAGPLALGFTAEAEVMDVTLDERVSLVDFRERLLQQTSEDLSIVELAEVPLSTAAPQAALLWAEYAVDLPGVDPERAGVAVREFVAKDSLPWTEERREKERTFDLRQAAPIVVAMPADGGTRLTMRLRADQELMARPEQLLAALLPGAEASVICRTGLLFDEVSPARDAYRRRGRFIE